MLPQMATVQSGRPASERLTDLERLSASPGGGAGTASSCAAAGPSGVCPSGEEISGGCAIALEREFRLTAGDNSETTTSAGACKLTWHGSKTRSRGQGV